ncbi:MAG TPA: type VII secretion integral membrane protein EccD, partial [Mycobacterium sp.]|nr:type VII secretion integral membrane protein EccD [Mycobacterium sp.]
MPNALCRLVVEHESHAVDLALPKDTPLGLIMPSVVDLVCPDMTPHNKGHQWHLSRIGGGCLDESMSLRDCAVRDGELLMLTTTVVPAPARVPDDPWQAVVGAADVRSAPNRVTASAACLSATLLGAAGLLWSGIVTHAIGHVLTASATAATGAIGAVVARRMHSDQIFCVTLSVVAVAFGAVAGFLAVPARPSTANVLLAAAVACSTSIVVLRVARCGAICLTASATTAALVSAASA